MPVSYVAMWSAEERELQNQVKLQNRRGLRCHLGLPSHFLDESRAI